MLRAAGMRFEVKATNIPEPHGVDVIGIVLRVVQVDVEVRCLNPVIMRVAAVDTARPCDIDIPASLVYLSHPAIGQLLVHVASPFQG